MKHIDGTCPVADPNSDEMCERCHRCKEPGCVRETGHQGFHWSKEDTQSHSPMTNLEQLKKDAREKVADAIEKFDWVLTEGTGKEMGFLLNELIDHIHEQTVRECMKALPEERPAGSILSTAGIITMSSSDLQRYENRAYNGCRKLVISRLEALINPGV